MSLTTLFVSAIHNCLFSLDTLPKAMVGGNICERPVDSRKHLYILAFLSRILVEAYTRCPQTQNLIAVYLIFGSASKKS